MPRQSDLRYSIQPLVGDAGFEVVAFTLEEGISQPSPGWHGEPTGVQSISGRYSSIRSISAMRTLRASSFA